MKRLWRYTAVLFRFTLALFLLAVLSPAPDYPVNGTSSLSRVLQTLEGWPYLVISKSRQVLTLYKGMTPVRSYRAVFGGGVGDGDKQMSGDRRTPEGEFYICSMNHSKRFYKFMGLSYPGLKHAGQGLRSGLISIQEYLNIDAAIREGRQPPWETRLGGAIGIHGRILNGPALSLSPENWTDGCIALANEDVDELFGVVSLGTPVVILQ